MIISANKWEHDVQGYLNICNITDTTPRKQIRDFAAGVNDLGLWDSMVCWPLRSTQNAGTGTTAFSLGGLGSYNGTLTNGPTWGADGVSFDGSDDLITTTFNPAFNNVCVFASANTTNRLGRRMVYAQKNDSANQGFDLFNEGISTPGETRSQVYDGGFKSSNAGAVTDGQFASLGSFWDKANLIAHRDGSVGATAATNSATTVAATIGNNNGFRPFLGTIAGVIVVHNQGNVFAAVRTLYKSTLGLGLGLS